ncbi:MAG: hypothetical protein R3228_12750, partial [Halioglobus sp.]|nr:hypothetical protein [Halioglobus sp.]
MSATNYAGIALGAARGGVHLLADAVGDLTGASMPYLADDVAQPRQLSRLINGAALPACPGPVDITGLQRQDIPSVSSNCHNLVLTIEQRGEPVLPGSLFVKLPMESLATRWFFDIINSWRLESHFFRHVATSLPLRTPVTYATAWQGTRFFLVQENLHEDPAVELFTNPDMVHGPTLDQVHRCLDTFARLHASHCGLRARERETILPLDYHPFLSPGMGPLSRALNALALQPCLRKRPGE